MSIYHPPSKIQGIFNPSNFGGLGPNDEITTNYLDAKYIQFPVAQGNTTLVSTSILGNLIQQGNFTTNGDISAVNINASSFLVGDTNVIYEIGTKQDTIQDGDLTIAKTDGLQTALDDKQDTITDGDLTIAKTAGLQTSLTTLDTDITTINKNNTIYDSN